ncbi:MAG: hypothetical protein AAGE85_04670 [Pseudomonadota bacterium]
MSTLSSNAYFFGLAAVAYFFTLYLLSGVFLDQLQKVAPQIFEEISQPENLFGNALGPMKLGLVYIIPMDYEKWGLNSRVLWIGRALFTLNLIGVIAMLFFAVSLL